MIDALTDQQYARHYTTECKEKRTELRAKVSECLPEHGEPRDVRADKPEMSSLDKGHGTTAGTIYRRIAGRNA